MSVIMIFLIISAHVIYDKDGIKIIVPDHDNFELTVNVSVRDSEDINGITHYIYEYTLINAPTSGSPVWCFEIPRSVYYKFSGIVSVYDFKNGDTTISVAGWPCIPKDAYWRSGSSGSLDLMPGDTLSGFIFITREIPDISFWNAVGTDTIYCPRVIGCSAEAEWVEDTIEKTYDAKTPFGEGKYGKTLGPGPNPPGYEEYGSYYVTREGFQHLIDKANGCYDMGWITRKQTRDHIIGMIERARNHYDGGRYRQMRHVLEQLLQYIEDKRGSLILENGYYILYYRTRFVMEHIYYGG